MSPKCGVLVQPSLNFIDGKPPNIAKMNVRSGIGRFPCLTNHFAMLLTSTCIVILIAVPSLAQADPEGLLVAEIEKRSSRQTYCGSRLVDALSLACAGNYNKKKKNIATLDDEPMQQQETDPEYWQSEFQENTLNLLQGLQAEPGNKGWIPRQSRFPFRERLNARAFLSHGLRRKTRGVHDECCAKSCSMQELRAYCA